MDDKRKGFFLLYAVSPSRVGASHLVVCAWYFSSMLLAAPLRFPDPWRKLCGETEMLAFGLDLCALAPPPFPFFFGGSNGSSVLFV